MLTFENHENAQKKASIVEAGLAIRASFPEILFLNVCECAVQVLLFHDQTYGIHYEYTVSLNQSQENISEVQPQPEHLYLWTHSSWEGCRVQCGGG